MKASDLIAVAHNGVVGINESLEVYGGYDQKFLAAGASVEWPEYVLESPVDYVISPEEKIQLAEIMIARWEKYKKAAIAQCATTGGDFGPD